MKTLLKIFGILLLVIIVLVIALPIIFKGKITEVAKEEINKSVNAQVELESVGFTLFKSFPNFNLNIKNLVISGNEPFEGDTLAFLRSIDVSIDLFSVISGSNYSIRKIAFTSPDIYIKVLEDGSTNYDIAVASDQTTPAEESPAEESAAFTLQIKNFIISNANFVYEDQSLGMKVGLLNMDHKLSGDFSADMTDLNTKTTIGKLNLTFDGIEYFKNTATDYNAIIQADLKNEIYTLKKNNLFLNNLQLQFEGSVSMIKDDINLVLTFNTPKTEFKELLSLIPAIYVKDFETVQTSGKMSVSGHVKGIYNETSLPAFDLNLEVNDAMFRYPDLPEAVERSSFPLNFAVRSGSETGVFTVNSASSGFLPIST
jgi:uncharacterized protein involved in outer membrane biogenesis